MPKTSEPLWVKSIFGFRKQSDPFCLEVDKIAYRNWRVQWTCGLGDRQFYMDGIETAALGRVAADSLLARLTAAIAVKEESACSAG